MLSQTCQKLQRAGKNINTEVSQALQCCEPLLGSPASVLDKETPSGEAVCPGGTPAYAKARGPALCVTSPLLPTGFLSLTAVAVMNKSLYD